MKNMHEGKGSTQSTKARRAKVLEKTDSPHSETDYSKELKKQNLKYVVDTYGGMSSG